MSLADPNITIYISDELMRAECERARAYYERLNPGAQHVGARKMADDIDAQILKELKLGR